MLYIFCTVGTDYDRKLDLIYKFRLFESLLKFTYIDNEIWSRVA